jgi:hypothetical protein
MEVKLAPGATHGRPLLLAKAISDLTTLKGGEYVPRRAIV